tara:strand:+ start:968 stop:1180 length:213 start_codon:yes stop_codon:yes gene_type:complete
MNIYKDNVYEVKEWANANPKKVTLEEVAVIAQRESFDVMGKCTLCGGNKKMEVWDRIGELVNICTSCGDY